MFLGSRYVEAKLGLWSKKVGAATSAKESPDVFFILLGLTGILLSGYILAQTLKENKAYKQAGINETSDYGEIIVLGVVLIISVIVLFENI